jgi:hypothetical protein
MKHMVRMNWIVEFEVEADDSDDALQKGLFNPNFQYDLEVKWRKQSHNYEIIPADICSEAYLYE